MCIQYLSKESAWSSEEGVGQLQSILDNWLASCQWGLLTMLSLICVINFELCECFWLVGCIENFYVTSNCVTHVKLTKVIMSQIPSPKAWPEMLMDMWRTEIRQQWSLLTQCNTEGWQEFETSSTENCNETLDSLIVRIFWEKGMEKQNQMDRELKRTSEKTLF